LLIACGGSPRGLRVGFSSSLKLDGTDALNSNDLYNVYGTYNIWRVNADGTGLTPLTNATATDASSVLPQWSPDDSKIVFDSSRRLNGADAANGNANPTYNIWRANANGTGLTPLTNATASQADSGAPKWSPDGSKVVFVSRRNLDGTDTPSVNFTYNIWRANADGTGLTPLTNTIANGAGGATPQWSPDGSNIVFNSSRRLDGTDAPNANFTFNIWRMSADGTGLTPLTNATAARADSAAPQWSPDGSKIVFNSSRRLDGADAPNANFTYNIWRMNADGTGLVPLTTATALGADSAGLQWSPDGSKLVFNSSRSLDGTDAPNTNRTSNIWHANADGTGLVPLTTATALGADSFEPQWSPDGSKLVFNSTRKLDGTDARNPNLTTNIWLVNADGTGLIPLTKATAYQAHSYSASFSR
jgi:Tol biopolymer transport system component